MNELEIMIISLSALLIYGWYFRVRWLMLLMGIPAFIGAYFIEERFVGFINPLLIVLLVAPVVEEVLKFLCTIKGKDVRTAMSVGLTFATLEDILYYITFQGMFFFVFSLREFTDPILHMTTTTFSVRTWERKFMGITTAIILHITWNLYGFLTTEFSYLIYAIAIVYGIILTFNLEKNKKKNIRLLTES